MTVFGKRIRLSPSGPFIGSGPNDEVLVGTGTPGIILRAFGTSLGVTQITSAGNSILSVAGPVDNTHKYDIEAGVWVNATDTFALQLQYSINNGSTWVPIPATNGDGTVTAATTDTTTPPGAGLLAIHRRLDPAELGIAVPITNFRFHGAATAGDIAILSTSPYLRVQQYSGEP